MKKEFILPSKTQPKFPEPSIFPTMKLLRSISSFGLYLIDFTCSFIDKFGFKVFGFPSK